MGFSTLRNVRLAGMATCVPHRKISNLRDCPPNLRAERERLIRNIGIENRRLCSEWQCFSDLAYEATVKLLDGLNWSPSEVDALIVVTQSPDYLIPSTAIIMQDRLKFSQATIAYDVNLGCSGYPFGLHLLGNMIQTGSIKKAILLVGDKSASINNPLFSDAGTATALEYCDNAEPIYFNLNSDGSGYKAIFLPVGGHREPYAPHHSVPRVDDEGILHWPSELILDGPSVLSFSTQKMPIAVENSLNYANIDINTIDYFVFHQANRIINETIRKKLRLSESRVPSTLSELGNTSGASIPVTITCKLRELLAGNQKKLLLGGFGVGLSWGVSIINIENAFLPELIEA